MSWIFLMLQVDLVTGDEYFHNKVGFGIGSLE